MEKIVLLDGSRRMHNSISIEAIKDIARLRDISVEYHECPNFIDAIVNRSFNPRRNGHNGQGQVHEGAMLQNLDNETKIQRLGNDGKIILFDEDLYDDGLNWCFGGFSGTARGLGYILLST
ncbi:MAG: hypothetical protein NTZ83_05890, partial [Candidatus Pacearchaeota archaeon]|nr:hypothetical protein [Candidatus Pacearchaeota archaeon]